ncbi:MAG: hypothetical protein WBD02_11370 [Acidimicrobiia bacterium]
MSPRSRYPYETPLISWIDVARGAGAGAGILILGGVGFGFLSSDILGTTDFRFYVFLLQLAAFFLAGYTAGYAVDDAPASNGMVAALGTIAVWVPVRALLWHMNQRSEGVKLFSDQAISVPLLIAACGLAVIVGIAAAYIGAGMADWRRERQRERQRR